MLTPGKGAIALLLFLLVYVAVSRLLAAAFGKPRRARPVGFRPGRTLGFGQTGRRVPKKRGFGGTVRLPLDGRSLAELLQTAEVNVPPAGFAVLSAVLGAAGVAAGSVLFGSLKGVIVPGGLLLLAPSLWVRSRLVNRQIKRRKELLPALESFYQGYVLSPGRNIRIAVRQAVESGRLPRHAQLVFERLHAGLTVHWDQEDALRLFAASFSSRWADLFAALLRTALDNGTDIGDGLRELVADMRRAARSDQAERNRLLEIRLANFSPLLFLAVFLAVNFRMDPDMARRYYFLTDTGKEMLLDAFVLIGLSFVMGIYLSLRKE